MKNRKENLSGSTVSVRPAVSFSLFIAKLEQQRTPTDLDNRASRAIACSSKKESQISSILISMFCYESVESLGLHWTSLSAYSVEWESLHLVLADGRRLFMACQDGRREEPKVRQPVVSVCQTCTQVCRRKTPLWLAWLEICEKFPILWALRISATFPCHREVSAWWSNALRAVAKLCQGFRSCRVKAPSVKGRIQASLYSDSPPNARHPQMQGQILGLGL